MMRNLKTNRMLMACLALAGSVLAMMSCHKEIHTYTGVPGVYFAMRVQSNVQNADTVYREHTLLPFATTLSQDSTLNIRVKILGKVSGEDRHFLIRTIGEESTVLPEECEFPDGEHLLKAGEIYGLVPIVFHRTASLEGQEKRLTIELVENEDFKLPIKKWKNGNSDFADVIRHTIVVSDKFVELPGYSEYYFGPFSEKKMRLLLELSGKKLGEFNEPLPYVYCKALGQQLDRYLRTQQAKGEPVLEKDGSPMVSGKGIYN